MTTIIENIDQKKACNFFADNKHHLKWNDGSEITIQDIMNFFRVTKYDNGNINLEHKSQDFRIEDIYF